MELYAPNTYNDEDGSGDDNNKPTAVDLFAHDAMFTAAVYLFASLI